MNSFLKAIVLSAAFIGGPASASIISTSGTINNINGLDWLDLTETFGLTLSEALSRNAGYRIATRDEFDDMFALFDTRGDSKFFDVDAPSDSATSHNEPFSGSDLSALADNSFFSAFGVSTSVTDDYADLYESQGRYGELYVTVYGYLERSRGGAFLSVRGPRSQAFFDNAATFRVRTVGDNNPVPGVGTYLVRAQAIPEPSMIALMGLGLFGLGLSRRPLKK